MNKKIKFLKSLQNTIKKETPKRYYTMEEKRQMILEGKQVPIYTSKEKVIRDFIVPIHQFIPSKYVHKKAKKLKI